MGVLVLFDIRGWGGGVVQNRESPDLRSPEVGRYVTHLLRQDARIPSVTLTYFINDSFFLLILTNVKHTSFNPMFCFENCFYSYKNTQKRKTCSLINIGN